jgi:hypothetical protein
MAIRLFRSKDFACSITLALAAEEQMPEGDGSHLFAVLKDRYPDQSARLNDVRNWLKHYKPNQPEIDIFGFDVELALMRAVSKFAATFGRMSPAMAEFDRRCIKKGYRSKRPLTDLRPPVLAP